MASSTPARVLKGAGSDDQSLALKRFSGQVLRAFRPATLLWDSQGSSMGIVNLTSGGKSAQWPIFSDPPASEIHQPGTERLGNAISMVEAVVTVDDFLTSHVDIGVEDLNLSHFPILDKAGMMIGNRLAEDLDKRGFVVGLQAARTAAVTSQSIAVHSGGNRVTRDTGTDTGTPALSDVYTANSAGATAFIDDVAQLAQLMDEDNVPKMGRSLYINPYIRRVLGKETNIFDRDFSVFGAGTNDLNTRAIGILQGFRVFVTNHLPNTDNLGTTTTAELTKYQGNFTGVQTSSEDYGLPAALALCNGGMAPAIGMVVAEGLTSDVVRDHRRNTFFSYGQIHLGMGVVAPWCAGEIAVIQGS